MVRDVTVYTIYLDPKKMAGMDGYNNQNNFNNYIFSLIDIYQNVGKIMFSAINCDPTSSGETPHTHTHKTKVGNTFSIFLGFLKETMNVNKT